MVRLWPVVLVGIGCGRVGFDQVTASAVTITYPQYEVDAVLGATALQLVPAVTGQPVDITIDPPLPAGLSIDPASGAISGTPTDVASLVQYTIVATSQLDPTLTANEHVVIDALPGSVVDANSDAADDDGGTDATCFATSAGGCTLRAALQTANHQTTPQLVLLPPGSFMLGSALDPITNDITIAAQKVLMTKLQAATLHPGYNLASLATAHTLRFSKLVVEDFGGVNGGAVSVTGGTFLGYASTFANNASAGSGGVLFITGATAELDGCTFTANTSNGGNGWGGVIDGEGSGTMITVKSSTATENQAPWGSFSHITTGAKLTLINSTLTSNIASTAGTLASPGGTYTLVNDTIVSNTNTATDSAGIYLFSAPAHYTLSNTIVALNTDASGGENDCNRRDLTTSVTSMGGNMFGDSGQNCAAYLNGPGDVLATEPQLDPSGLANNGGGTQTILLAPGSPAASAGVLAQCPIVDQRSYPRPAPSKPPGVSCDVGAIEMQ